MANKKIGIVGSGIVGRSWTLLFISQGHSVTLYDISEPQLNDAYDAIRENLVTLEQKGYLKGDLSVVEQFSLVSTTTVLEECVRDCYYIQECVFEKLEVKQEVVSQIDACLGDGTIVGSSASILRADDIFEKASHRANMLVAHPINPTYHIPLVEVAPSQWTNPATVQSTKELMSSLGQSPVILNKHVTGLLVNRLQYVLINECWNLVKEGVVSVEDVDKVMTDGLGMRYSVVGVLEGARLNANGMEDYFERYARGLHNVNRTLLPHPEYTRDEVTAIEKEMVKSVPLDKLAERRQWRDERLAKISLLKREDRK